MTKTCQQWRDPCYRQSASSHGSFCLKPGPLPRCTVPIASFAFLHHRAEFRSPAKSPGVAFGVEDPMPDKFRLGQSVKYFGAPFGDLAGDLEFTIVDSPARSEFSDQGSG